MRALCCDVFGLQNQFLRNNNNKDSRSNVNKHEMRQMSVYHLCYCLQSLLLFLRKIQFFSSPKTSQQSVRKPYRPLLLFNSPCCPYPIKARMRRNFYKNFIMFCLYVISSYLLGPLIHLIIFIRALDTFNYIHMFS